MSDFATLGMDIETQGLTAGQRELRNLETAGARAEQRLNRSSDAMASGFRNLARVAGGLAGAVAAAFSFRAVVSTLSGFESSMSRVAAISGATGAQLEQLRRTAQALGSSTEFSAGQAADALGFLSMAGFDAAESMAAIPSVLDLATASGMDLASTADIASNVLSGFGLAATDAGRAADVLAEAASTTNTNVSQLGQAMSTAAPIAASLGVSMEETAAAIGVMSDAGIQGERAGTALRGIFASLAGPTRQAQQALARYGLTAADVNPETNDLADVLAVLRERGISTADAMEIFGREAASGALVMIDTADRVRDLTTQFEGATGAATDMANVMRDNLGGDLNGLRSALEGLIIAIGDSGVTGALRAAVQALTDLVRFVTDNIGALTALAQVAGVLMVARLGAMAVAAGSAAFSLGATTAAAVTLTGALGAASRAATVMWAAIGGPVGAAIAGAAGLMLIVRANMEVRDTSNLAADAQALYEEAIRGVVEASGMSAAGDYIRQLTDQKNAALDAAQAEIALLEARMNVAAFTDPDAYLMLGGQMDALVRTVARLRGELAGLRGAAEAVVDEFHPLPGIVFEADRAAGQLVTQIEALSAADLSGLNSGVSFLAERLGIAAEQAAILNSVLNNTAGISEPTAGGLSFGMGGINTQEFGDFGNQELGFGNIPTTRSFVPNLSSNAPTTGGGRVGGGGGASGEAPLTVLEALLGTNDPRAEIEAWYAEANAALAEAQLLERGLHQEHADYRLQIEQLYQDQLMALRRQQADENLSHYQSFFGTMASVFQSGSDRMLGISRAFGLAEAAISIWRGAARALELPFPANLSAWAQVLATGAKAIQGIKSAKPGSASLGGSGGQASAPARPTQNIVIDMVGASPSQMNGIQSLVDMLTEANRQGYDLNAIVRPA